MPALPAAERARLEQAYRATTYRIHGPTGDIDLRIGEASPALDALLQEAGADCWAIITAWNPGSQLTDAAANAAAQARLQEWLAANDYRWLPGENLADAGDWPAEPTVWVAGMPAEIAIECGAEYGQAAVVAGSREAAALIEWCERKLGLN